MREVPRLSGLEAPVRAIADDAAPVLVFLAQLAVGERVEQRLAARAVAFERAEHVHRDLAALQQLETRGEQILAAVVVGPAAVRVQEMPAPTQHAERLREKTRAVVVEVRRL